MRPLAETVDRTARSRYGLWTILFLTIVGNSFTRGINSHRFNLHSFKLYITILADLDLLRFQLTGLLSSVGSVEQRERYCGQQGRNVAFTMNGKAI